MARIVVLGGFDDRSIADDAVRTCRFAVHSTIHDSTIGHRIDGRPVAAEIRADSIFLRSITVHPATETTLALRAVVGQPIIGMMVAERTIPAIA